MDQQENVYSELNLKKIGGVKAKLKNLKLYIFDPKPSELIMSKLKVFEEKIGGLHSYLLH